MTSSPPQPYALRLLDEVSWHGRPITGNRPQSLLAALAAASGPVTAEQLVAPVWQDDPPANPAKAVQVLVSRIRGIDRGLVDSVAGGDRLGLAADQVDAVAMTSLVGRAQEALADGNAPDAAEHATRALAFRIVHGGPPPLAELRARAGTTRLEAQRVLGVALARTGQPSAAVPHLNAVLRRTPDDVEVRVAALRGVAAVQGTAAALTAYDGYRSGLIDRLGVDPDPQLQRLHRELLAADAPVRTGVQYDVDPLLGREDDLARLRAAQASGRLVTVMGPGGIGKTRIAQVLASEATQPRVHVAELVGVGSGDDVVAAIGAAVGVRDGLAHRALTAAQRSDLRGRIAQHLDDGPTLVVLDNCEHVLEQVSALVAFLLVTCRELTVLVTSRAPLRIAAERVVPLSQLGDDDAGRLFRRRARAVRPDAVLDDDVVQDIVARLDGLPLAVELAAARVRTMTAVEVRSALVDRLGTLRTRDRVAPARHRTLASVIGWSWDLLEPREQQALAWMSLFHDGFDRHAARMMLGADGPELVESLLEQSLLVHSEYDGHSRFRALETIREFAARELDQLPDPDRGRRAAERAQEAWARSSTTVGAGLLFDADQERLVDDLTREQSNLADVLRRAMAKPDPGLVAHLLATLGTLWMITGQHSRVFAVLEPASHVFDGYQPAPEEQTAVTEALGPLMLHQSWISNVSYDGLTETLRSVTEEPATPWAKVVRAMFGSDSEPPVDSLRRLADEEPDPAVRASYLLWSAVILENEADLQASEQVTRRALDGLPLTPYLEATLLAQLAQLLASTGRFVESEPYAVRAIPMLERLHADDDARMMQMVAAMAAIDRGDIAAAERQVARLEGDLQGGQTGSRMMAQICRAEVSLARDEIDAGLATYVRAVEEVNGVAIPNFEISPWQVMAGEAAMASFVRWPDRCDRDLAMRLRDQLSTGVRLDSPLFRDRPLLASALVAFALWYVRWGSEQECDAAIRAIATAKIWHYNRAAKAAAWKTLVELADERRPGVLESLACDFASLPTDDLFEEVRGALGVLTTSSG